MRTKPMKPNQFEKNVKRFGHPKYHKGQQVRTSLTGNDILTISRDAWSNGYTWMYSFENPDRSIGQSYITSIV